MPADLNIGVVGLGVMGQRMLERLVGHPRLKPGLVWDANPQAVARAVQAHPGLRAAASAEQLVSSPGLHCLYIATPPQAHMALSHAAFDAGLAVLCEKPLTVDFDAARGAIARIAREHHRAAVNFSLASSRGLALLQDAFGAGGARPLGALEQITLELGFAAWPRPWQAAAGAWLSERAEGGFAREVLSHFVFVLQRVLGPARVQGSAVTYPPHARGAETALQATVRAGGVPVRITGRVDAAVAVPDYNRMLWSAGGGEIALRDWYAVARRRPGSDWETLAGADAARASGQADQLAQWVRLIEGQDHTLPGYGEALAVQETIEAVLGGA